MDEGGPSYAPRTGALNDLELSVEKCFDLFKAGHLEAIKIGLMPFGVKNFFFDFNPHVTGSTVPGASPDKPNYYRIYIDVKAQTEHQIRDSSLMGPMGFTDLQVVRKGGDVLYDEPIAIKLHLCPKGMFIHFDPRRDPDSSLTVKLGESSIRHNTEADIGDGAAISQERRDTELYVRRCISYARDIDSRAIKVGRGEWENYEIFIDFMMPQYKTSEMVGNIPQAYRIYVDVSRSEKHQLLDAIWERPSNENFVAGYDGMIYGPSIAKIQLHACTGGVSIHFDPAVSPSLPLNYNIGPSTARLNQFSADY